MKPSWTSLNTLHDIVNVFLLRSPRRCPTSERPNRTSQFPKMSVHVLLYSTAGVLQGEQEACRPRPADQRRSWRTGARNTFSWQPDQCCSRYQQNWFQSLFCELVQAFQRPAGTALSRCVSRWNALLKSLKSILSPPDERGPTMCVHRLFRGTSITLLEDHRSRMCFRMDLLE